MSSIKISRIPGKTSVVQFEGEMTVGEALKRAQVFLGEGEGVRVNGAEVKPDDNLTGGEKIHVAKGAKANS